MKSPIIIVTFQFNMHLKSTLVPAGKCIIQEILTKEQETLRGNIREPRKKKKKKKREPRNE